MTLRWSGAPCFGRSDVTVRLSCWHSWRKFVTGAGLGRFQDRSSSQWSWGWIDQIWAALETRNWAYGSWRASDREKPAGSDDGFVDYGCCLGARPCYSCDHYCLCRSQTEWSRHRPDSLRPTAETSSSCPAQTGSIGLKPSYDLVPRSEMIPAAEFKSADSNDFHL